jgi:hypothetical protein
MSNRPTPETDAATPSSDKPYWHQQPLMRERSYKLMDENSEKAKQIREFEGRWQLRLSLEKIKLWATLPATLSLWETAKNETRTALYLMRAIAHEAENALKEERDK